MGTIIGMIVIAALLVVIGYTFLVTTGYDNFKGINLQLDERYTNTNEMACAVFEKLTKQGKECEILETGKEYPKFLINGKKYTMIHKMASMRGIPVQAIQLKICKK